VKQAPGEVHDRLAQKERDAEDEDERERSVHAELLPMVDRIEEANQCDHESTPETREQPEILLLFLLMPLLFKRQILGRARSATGPRERDDPSAPRLRGPVLAFAPPGYEIIRHEMNLAIWPEATRENSPCRKEEVVKMTAKRARPRRSDSGVAPQNDLHQRRAGAPDAGAESAWRRRLSTAASAPPGEQDA
jgi:hypothetical protein